MQGGIALCHCDLRGRDSANREHFFVTLLLFCGEVAMPVIFSITYHALWPFDCRYVCVRTQAAHDLQKAGSPQFVLEDMDFGRRCGAGFSGIGLRYWGFLVALAPPLPIARLLPCTGTPWKKRFARPATMCHRQTRCLTRAATSCWCPASWASRCALP
jgi:hypothetical protein